ncbi:PilW family protein [Candidatus Thiodictyon syntrophicum]|uniref:Pilus assembly protein PilW n=1 Tax=Candidatus Thiodictyon syntrophicum TaxID=1166950 RepID=A0A2K8UFN8_9GAMM|nr:PilW family protein [Candidatus Thiodictyon syntrophicum]AUB84362.1 hypothetical protein THSYN_27780 [Candidatus Thiodictyon syntrophicum]
MVEILVALVLGLLLIGGIIQVLDSNRTTYRLAEAKARAQESGRYAIQLLAKEMRPSRSSLCRNVAHEEMDNTMAVHACALLADPTACSGNKTIGTRTPLGYSASAATAAGLAGLPSTARADVGGGRLRGDVLVAWGAVGEFYYAQANTLTSGNPPAPDLTHAIDLIADTSTAGLKALKSAGFTGGHLAIITDCENSDVFTISNTDGTTGTASLEHALSRGSTKANMSAAVSTSYNYIKDRAQYPGARVAAFDLRVFYICCMDQDTGLLQSGSGVANCTDTPTQYRPALCRWSATSPAVAVIASDIADLRVTYDGRLAPDAVGNPVRFSDSATLQTAAEVTSQNRWDRVYSARVELLVTGGDEVRRSAVLPAPAAAAATATDLGWNMVADKRLYETFSSAIAIRALTPWYRDQ